MGARRSQSEMVSGQGDRKLLGNLVRLKIWAGQTGSETGLVCFSSVPVVQATSSEPDLSHKDIFPVELGADSTAEDFHIFLNRPCTCLGTNLGSTFLVVSEM